MITIFSVKKKKSNTQNRKMTTWKWLKWGMRWETSGVICGRASLKSTSQNRCLGSRRVQFTEERITTTDYLSRVIKAVLPNSIITHLKKASLQRGAGARRKKRKRSSGLHIPSVSVRWWICLMVSRISGIITQRIAQSSQELRADHLHTQQKVFM